MTDLNNATEVYFEDKEYIDSHTSKLKSELDILKGKMTHLAKKEKEDYKDIQKTLDLYREYLEDYAKFKEYYKKPWYKKIFRKKAW